MSGFVQRSGACSTESASARYLRTRSGSKLKPLMSAPAQKAFSPEPVMMPARISSSPSIFASPSKMPWRMAVLRALSFAGSSRVRMAVLPRFSKFTPPSLMAVSVRKGISGRGPCASALQPIMV